VAHQLVLILDFGSQYTQLIARRIREHAVYCEVHPHHLSLERIRALAPSAIVLSGGPSSCYAPGAPQVDPGIYDLGRADARHLLRRAAHRAPPGRRRPPGRQARVRAGRGPGPDGGGHAAQHRDR
jgi:hypothetical protein